VFVAVHILQVVHFNSFLSSFVVDFLEEATVLQGERGFEFLMKYVILTLWVYGV
jgi:hypothetical protein